MDLWLRNQLTNKYNGFVYKFKTQRKWEKMENELIYKFRVEIYVIYDGFE